MRPMVLVALLGGVLAASPAPARAEEYDYDRTLFVNGKTGTVDVVQRADARILIEWNLPAVDTSHSWNPWEVRVSSRPIACTFDDVAFLLPARSYLSPHEAAHWRWDREIPDFHIGASYYVRACLEVTSWIRHRSNQVEIRVGPEIVAARAARRADATVPAGTPLITGFLGPTPVRPGDLTGVTGQSFGAGPGRLILQVGAAAFPLVDLDWRSDSIGGRLPWDISGLPDGPAFLTVERSDHVRSGSRPVNFKARQEVRLIPGGEVRVDSCSTEAEINWCRSTASPGAPSIEAYHGSPGAGESGIDGYSVDLAPGWRFFDLEFSLGESGLPVPTWSHFIRSSTDLNHPHISVSWRNPDGPAVHHNYAFRLYVVGPEGVPHR